MTHSLLMSDPPQKCDPPEPCRLTCQGQLPAGASSPPTILGFTGVVPHTETTEHSNATFSYNINGKLTIKICQLDVHIPSAERLVVGAVVVGSGEGPGGGGGGSPGQVKPLSASGPEVAKTTNPGASLWILELIQDWKLDTLA